ncbi:hypothetical protein [Wenyingzhuangia sp. 2_MG-2023]|uniref:hypothetical protein n=1 Tax=Wenyingzhuangia sp. 2_MG-2023 TaxID=3062639 RepID=UPI0026E1F420|nr:hypothetical protein [Wenyingzhuangia sp. 2_MG-2023]MDO6737105.1 hypothetical protein [Wenyingzhuangia sp. 2_MG-2023]
MPIDYKKYPPNWLSEIRPRIMKRANNKCECCGLEHKQIVFAIKLFVRIDKNYKQRTIWFRNLEDAERELMQDKVKEVKVVITIAHLDHDELNHEVKDDRLKAMCQICHLRYDAKEKYRRSLF